MQPGHGLARHDALAGDDEQAAERPRERRAHLDVADPPDQVADLDDDVARLLAVGSGIPASRGAAWATSGTGWNGPAAEDDDEPPGQLVVVAHLGAAQRRRRDQALDEQLEVAAARRSSGSGPPSAGSVALIGVGERGVPAPNSTKVRTPSA